MLYVNGRRLGQMTPEGYATFTMKGVQLTPGVNVVEARAKGGAIDRVEWILEQ